MNWGCCVICRISEHVLCQFAQLPTDTCCISYTGSMKAASQLQLMNYLHWCPQWASGLNHVKRLNSLHDEYHQFIMSVTSWLESFIACTSWTLQLLFTVSFTFFSIFTSSVLFQLTKLITNLHVKDSDMMNQITKTGIWKHSKGNTKNFLTTKWL